jgi:hypothetical protein
MSHLASLLGAKEPMFSIMIDGLNKTSRQKAVDVKLVSGLHYKKRQLLVELGLDPGDTTAKELHQALLMRFIRDCKNVGDQISGMVLPAPRAISWTAVFRSYLENYLASDIKLDPKIEKLNHQLTELAKNSPTLKFWAKHLYTGVLLEGQVVSANFFDLNHTRSNRLAFGQHSRRFFERSLFDELMRRYGG